ncbi:G-protein coupled receptor 183-A-like [Haliotis rufescens]|uniref:G-protein coupled receptor 183-A-like n=1 Tax=Haliotis rufescens TaxID=6454 RepID=UPI00201F900D|nr:G-protein coupled receptor 183-A-like [Haliotis rufescens]
MPSINVSDYTVIEIDVNDIIDDMLIFNATNSSMAAGLQDNPWYVFVRKFQTVMIPIVCVVGFVGNILAAGAFLSPTLRNTSCCLHLAVKSISDVGFLLSLFIVWLYRLEVPAFTTQGVCQVTVFLTYVSGFLSVWFVVMITCENFIRVSLPGHVAIWCSVARAKFTILLLILLSVGIYSFSLWTTGVIHHSNGANCLAFEEYEKLVMAMTYVDSILTLVIPLVAMVFLNVGVAVGAINAHKRRKRLFQSISRSSSRKKRESSSPEAKVSKLLFAVSMIFLLLHTPSHVIRIKMMWVQILYKSAPTLCDIILHRVFELMYYMNFSVHCVVYLIFGDNFRTVFKLLYLPICFKSTPMQNNSFKTYCKRGSETEAILK